MRAGHRAHLQHPAVHGVRRPGQVARVPRGEERDHRGDLRPTTTAGGMRDTASGLSPVRAHSLADEFSRKDDPMAADASPSLPAQQVGSAVVADVMRPAVTTVEAGAHLAGAAYLMKHSGDNALVVTSDDGRRRPLRVLTDTDISQA